MTVRKRGFTLTEMLVVLAIVSIVASILFPVFRSVKESSKRVVCASKLHNIQLASTLYLTDYDDRFVPVNHQPATNPNSSNDRTWVQLVLPYISGEFDVFRCPSDIGERPPISSTFDDDMVPGDTFSRYYSASLRSNAGYNYLNLSPVYRVAGVWTTLPKSASQLGDPSRTLMYVDTVWDRKPDGTPYGGGSWLVIPPCRYVEADGRAVDTFVPGTNNPAVFAASRGWSRNQRSVFVYGFAWPWHSGRMNLVRVDGSIASVTPGQLAAGCDVRPNWSGYIRDPELYVWDGQ